MTKWTLPSLLQLLLLLSLLVVPGVVQAQGTEAPSNDPTLKTFADANPGCTHFTDACQICVRREGGSFGCSSPGIACQRKTWTCRPQPPAVSPPERKQP